MPDELRAQLTLVLIKIHGMAFVEWALKWRMNRVPKRFADMSDDECWTRLRFRRNDLQRLVKVLGFDRNDAGDDEEPSSGMFVADNCTHLTGQELLMIGLHRLANVGSLKTSMSTVFELDFSQLSRAFGVFVRFKMLKEAQLGEAGQFSSYGDGIFPIESHLVGKFYLEPTEDER